MVQGAALSVFSRVGLLLFRVPVVRQWYLVSNLF